MLLKYKDLRDRGHGDRTTIWRKVKLGLFPQPVYDGDKPRWIDTEIDEYERSLPREPRAA